MYERVGIGPVEKRGSSRPVPRRSQGTKNEGIKPVEKGSRALTGTY